MGHSWYFLGFQSLQISESVNQSAVRCASIWSSAERCRGTSGTLTSNVQDGCTLLRIFKAWLLYELSQQVPRGIFPGIASVLFPTKELAGLQVNSDKSHRSVAAAVRSPYIPKSLQLQHRCCRVRLSFNRKLPHPRVKHLRLDRHESSKPNAKGLSDLCFLHDIDQKFLIQSAKTPLVFPNGPTLQGTCHLRIEVPRGLVENFKTQFMADDVVAPLPGWPSARMKLEQIGTNDGFTVCVFLNLCLIGYDTMVVMVW